MTPEFLNSLREYVSAEVYRQLTPDDLWAKVRDELDEVAFRVLLERIGGRVYQRCRAILRDDHLAEEAFQDMFRDLIRKRAAIPFYQAAAWVYQTATNHAKHLWRKTWFRGKRERVVCAEPAVSATPHVDHADEVDRLLVALPNRFRRPIDLVVYRQGWSVAHTSIVRYVTEGQPVLVEGKWGVLGVYLHPADKSCYGTQYTFHRSARSGHLLVGLGGSPGPDTGVNHTAE